MTPEFIMFTDSNGEKIILRTSDILYVGNGIKSGCFIAMKEDLNMRRKYYPLETIEDIFAMLSGNYKNQEFDHDKTKTNI